MMGILKEHESAHINERWKSTKKRLKLMILWVWNYWWWPTTSKAFRYISYQVLFHHGFTKGKYPNIWPTRCPCIECEILLAILRNMSTTVNRNTKPYLFYVHDLISVQFLSPTPKGSTCCINTILYYTSLHVLFNKGPTIPCF